MGTRIRPVQLRRVAQGEAGRVDAGWPAPIAIPNLLRVRFFFKAFYNSVNVRRTGNSLEMIFLWEKNSVHESY